MKKPIVGLIVLVLVAFGFVWFAATRPAPSPASEAPAFAKTLPLNKYLEHTSAYDIVANYASSTPLARAANATAVAAMRNFIAQTVLEFKDGESNTAHGDLLQINYLIGSSVRTVSYIYTVYAQTGGAHGTLVFHTFNFDMQTGKELSLADVFQSGSSYLVKLSDLARTKLPSVIGPNADKQAIAQGTAPQAANFNDFFFDNAYFVVLFPPGAVASVASGPETLRIPLSDLAQEIKPAYR